MVQDGWLNKLLHTYKCNKALKIIKINRNIQNNSFTRINLLITYINKLNKIKRYTKLHVLLGNTIFIPCYYLKCVEMTVLFDLWTCLYVIQFIYHTNFYNIILSTKKFSEVYFSLF